MLIHNGVLIVSLTVFSVMETVGTNPIEVMILRLETMLFINEM